MPDSSALLAFGLISLGMVLTPGPNMIYLISRSICQGRTAGLISLGGVALGFLVYLVCAALGITALLMAVPHAYDVLRFAGAAYLLYLAWQLWRANPEAEQQMAGASVGFWRLARQEFLVAAGNPKAILLFTAFLPQFVDPSRPVPAQFAVLGTLFLLLEWIAIGAYAWMGLHMRRWFAEPRGKRVFNRCCAGLLSAAASVLLFAKRA